MKRIIKTFQVIMLFSITCLYAIALPGFTQNPIMHEQTKSYVWGMDVNVHVNAPGEDSLKLDKETIICFFACPAGNTIEWTIGKQMEPGDDWHYDIQHIGAQTRFLRKVLKDKNLIVIYTQTTDNGWNLYSSKHTDHVQRIQDVTNYALQEFSDFDYKVTLNGHSAGGGFVLRNLLNHSEVPAWIDRLGFLDSNYNYKYDADEYDSLFTKFLMERDSTYICLLAYNDSVALYQGSPIVSATGGTWWNARYMKKRLDPVFNFADSHDVSFQRHIALNKRFEILLKENPTQAILHTVQVYKNGFIHSMLSGTAYENVGYEYYGEPAYLEYIQGNPPSRPEGVSATPAGDGNIRIQVNECEDATGYRVYMSAGNWNLDDFVTITSTDTVLSGLSNNLYYLRITAINEWGESEASEYLTVTPGSQDESMLLVNAVNRSYGNDYLLRHGMAVSANGTVLGSCSNALIESGDVNLSDYAMVDYVVGNEDRRNYPLSTTEISKIQDYLKQGGSLYISGLELAYDLDIKGSEDTQAFCHDYLKALGVSDKPNEESNLYYSAEFQGFDFFDIGLSFDFDDGSQGTYNVSDPDGISPVNGSYRSVVFSGYDASISCAGVAFSGTFPEGTAPGKVFFMTIPFESIVGDSVRTVVMAEIIDFLKNCGVGVLPIEIPQTTELRAPYPNPFNPITAISVLLSEPGNVELQIYDLHGRKIHTVYYGTKDAGKYSFNWNAGNVASGVYICAMKLDGEIHQTQKMVLMK
jgi:hypothetical protein